MASSSDASGSAARGWGFAILALALVATVAGGVWFSQLQSRSTTRRLHDELLTVARLRADEIAAWREDQLQDAGLIAANPFLNEALEAIRGGDTADGTTRLRSFIDAVRAEHDYDEILVVDRRGNAVVSTDGVPCVDPEALPALEEALRSGRPAFVDVHQSPGASSPLTAVIARLSSAANDTNGAPAAVVFCNATARSLEPTLTEWPTARQTAETYLVRRDGDELLVISRVRLREDPPLSLRLSPSAPDALGTSKPSDIAALRAVAGVGEMAHGVDYRGTEVLSVAVPVDGATWFVIAEIDTAEALLASRQRQWLLVAVVASLLATLGALALSLVLSQRRAHYRSLYRAEAARREAAERYEVTLRSIGDAVLVADAEGRVDMLNPVAERLTGWRSEESEDQPLESVFQIVSEETRATVENPVSKVLRDGLVVGLANHTLLIAKDGTERPIADSGAPIRDASGRITGVVLVFRDQTDERQRERQLVESELTYRTLFESAPEAVFIGVDGRFAAVNRACVELLGAASAGELLGLPTMDFFHPAFHEQIRGRVRQLEEDRRPVSATEEVLVTKDGREVPAEVSAVPFTYRGEQGALVFLRDLRARKAAEADRARLLFAMEHAGEAIIITDARGVIRYVNAAFTKVTGFASGEVIGREGRALLGSSSVDADTGPDSQTETEIADVLGAGGVWSGRVRCRRKDGSLYTAEATIAPVLDGRGEVSEYVTIHRDITEKLRLEEQFLHAQKMESVGRLAGGVAHDFNNMLSVIMGHAELAMLTRSPSPEIRANLQDILDASKRASQVTRQLLAFARKQAIAPSILDLNDLIETLLRMIKRLIGEDIELIWNPAPDLWPVRLDAAQFDQILANLCVNARDAILETGRSLGTGTAGRDTAGTGTGRILIETRNVSFDADYCAHHPDLEPGEYVMLAVSDDGAGMDQATRESIFEPFFTTKDSEHGTGLGLATVYGIVTQNGGFIHVYSEPGAGSSFRIYFPRQLAAGAPQTPAAQVEQRAVAPRGAGETILLVEDEPAVLRFATNALESLGYRVISFARPADALDFLRAHPEPIALLLTDVVMPGLNGRELAAEVRMFAPTIRTLFMSGYSTEIIANRGIIDDGVRFLQKPFSMADLASRVRDALTSPS